MCDAKKVTGKNEKSIVFQAHRPRRGERINPKKPKEDRQEMPRFSAQTYATYFRTLLDARRQSGQGPGNGWFRLISELREK